MIFKQYLNQASMDGVLLFLRRDTSVHLAEIIMVCRPCGGRSILSAVHLHPPVGNYHGSASKYVHDVNGPWVDGL